MMEAEREAAIKLYTVKHNNSMAAIPVIFLLVVIGLATALWIHEDRARDRMYRERKAQEAPATVVPDDEIWKVQEKVAAAMRSKADVNKDGLSNCIDAAVLFYQYFPDKNRVTIERNYNAKTKMNHLFNCVNINGVWRAVEPQARYRGWSTVYWMRDVWGTDYDYTLNEDTTDYYKVYAK